MKKYGLSSSVICQRLLKYWNNAEVHIIVFKFQNRFIVKDSDIEDLIEPTDNQRLFTIIGNCKEQQGDIASVLFDLSLRGWYINSLKKTDGVLTVTFQICSLFHELERGDIFHEKGEWRQVMTTNITDQVIEDFMSFFI